MSWEFFVAKSIVFKDKSKVSRPIINIALIGIVISLAAMIVSIAVVSGFKDVIKEKVSGFAAHIEITNYTLNNSFETAPVNENQTFLPLIKNIPEVKHVQIFATKSGIIKTPYDFQGIVLKGVGRDYDWSFLKKYIKNGTILHFDKNKTSNGIVISKKVANLLNLQVGDKIVIYFIQDPPRFRKLTIRGIYDTDFEEFDKMFAFVDIRHIQKLNNWEKNQVSGFEVILHDIDDLDIAKNKIDDFVASSIQPDGSLLQVKTVKDMYPYIFDWINLFNTNVFVIIILLLAVASMNLVSGLLIMILEKATTIGVLKALGAQNKSIIRIFVNVGAISVLKGIIIGNVLGIVLVLLQAQTHLIHLDPATYYVEYVPVKLNLSYLILLNVGVFIITTLILILPSLLVARIQPAKTIKFN